MIIEIGQQFLLEMSQEDLDAVGTQDRDAYIAHQGQVVTVVAHWPAMAGGPDCDGYLVRAQDGWEDMVYGDELKEIQNA